MDYEDIGRVNQKLSSTVWKKLTVEPVMFLYMGACMISTVVEQAFFVHKACMVNMGFPANVCEHINSKENEEYNKQVQIVVSTFHQYEGIAAHIVPMILAFYLGVWSDRKGRKLPLLLGLFGSFFYWLSLWINSLQGNWPLQVVLFTATFPAALTGNALAIFMSAFSYVSDVSTPEERTIRITLVEVAYLITMPTGVSFGSYLFNRILSRSYSTMFFISSFVVFLAILYTWKALEWHTNKESTRTLPPCGVKSTFLETLQVVNKPRPKYHTLFLILIIFAMAVYTFQRDEKNMTYLYTQLKFNWDVGTYSYFRTYQSTLFVFGLLIGVPLLGRVFALKDTVIIMTGAISHTLARIMYALVQTPYLFYVGATVGSLGPIVGPVLRSLTSKLVAASDRGKIFALLSVADTAVPMVSGAIYAQVYNATINYAPSSIFWVTVLSQTFVLICALVIHVLQGKEPITQVSTEEINTT